MGTMSKNVLKEFGGLIWHHPFIACCFLVLFTPPFFPVLRFFFPLLISTALFIVAIVTMGPHLREAATSINNEEEEGGDVPQLIKHNNNLQLVPEISWVDKTVLQLNDELVEEEEEEQLEQQLHEEEDHKKTWQQLVETDHITGNPSSLSSKDQSGQEKKTTSRWMDLRRIYKEKGITWIENLFRNENWKGAHGINDENVSILQEAFPHHHRDEEVEQKTVAAALESKKSSTDKSSSVELLKDFAAAYESDDGSNEGHSDLETGSPILQGNVHEEEEEEEEEEEALIHHAPPPQEEHGILSLAVPEVPSWEQQPHSILHVPPALHDKLDVNPPAVLGIMATEVQGSRLPVTKSIKEDGGQRACHNVISGIHESGSSAATKFENLSSVLCREETSGSENGLLEDAKSVSTTNEADRGIIIPVTTAIGDKSLGVGTGVDNNTPDLAIDTGILREEKSSWVCPIDATLGEEERSEVLSNTELHKEVITLPATEVEEGERFLPHMKTQEKSSPVGASDEEMSPVNSDTDQVTKTYEETQTFVEEERLGLHNRTDSLCATEIGEPSSLPEEIVLPAAEIYKKPPVPWTNTLQKTSGNTSSREISVEGVSAIATHNHKENLIPTTEVLEQTGSHVPFSPKREEGSSVPAPMVCLDDSPGLWAHEVPVAESVYA
ncbi:unnamed protein product [Sphagnum troendelagicum]